MQYGLSISLIMCLFLTTMTRSQQYQYYSNVNGNEDSISGNYLIENDQVPDYSARDPRTNRGPVLFPRSPVASPESSGVIVGASGYGFIPNNRDSKNVKFSFQSR